MNEPKTFATSRAEEDAEELLFLAIEYMDQKDVQDRLLRAADAVERQADSVAVAAALARIIRAYPPRTQAIEAPLLAACERILKAGAA